MYIFLLDIVFIVMVVSSLLQCASNYTSQTIPNGLGFGGQKNHFGIFVPASFDKGYTYPSVTFNNPLLSNKSEFSIDVIECWGIVSENNSDFKKTSTHGGTILQRFKEDRNMLNMVGIANASDQNFYLTTILLRFFVERNSFVNK